MRLEVISVFLEYLFTAICMHGCICYALKSVFHSSLCYPGPFLLGTQEGGGQAAQREGGGGAAAGGQQPAAIPGRALPLGPTQR